METILYAVNEGVATITLNRPQQMNAFNDTMHLELREALHKADADAAVRALLITGAGRGFCAGQDLGARNPQDGPRDLGETLETFYNPLMVLLDSIRKPKIAAVNGAAAGAGIGLALACDIVLAAQNAKFAIAFGKIGLIPDAGLSWRLVRLLGLARAKAFVLTQGVWTAERAKEYGLIWEVYEAAVLQARAADLARRLAYGAQTGTMLSIDALNQSLNHSLEEQLALEVRYQREAGYSAEYAEGVAAFLEKREAVFFRP